MAEIFNFNRIWWLLRRYFIENRHRELYYWGFFIIAFMFFRNEATIIGGIIVVAGAIFCGRFFREIHSPTSGLNYFMIPATQTEKLVASFLLTIVYFFGMMLVTYVMGNLAGTFLNNLIADADILSHGFFTLEQEPLQWCLLEVSKTEMIINGVDKSYEGSSNLWLLFKTYILVQAMFTLGSLYFKRSAVFKTFLTLFIFTLVNAIIVGVWLKYWVEGWEGSGRYMKITLDGETGPFGEIHPLAYIFVSYIWIISYFKLTEKEV